MNIVQTVTLHKVILSSLAELSQFQEGLSTLGVANALQNHPDLLHSYCCCDHDDKLTPGNTSYIYSVYTLMQVQILQLLQIQ